MFLPSRACGLGCGGEGMRDVRIGYFASPTVVHCCVLSKYPLWGAGGEGRALERFTFCLLEVSLNGAHDLSRRHFHGSGSCCAHADAHARIRVRPHARARVVSMLQGSRVAFSDLHYHVYLRSGSKGVGTAAAGRGRGRREAHVLRGVTGVVSPGQIMAIMGERTKGEGKRTL